MIRYDYDKAHEEQPARNANNITPSFAHLSPNLQNSMFNFFDKWIATSQFLRLRFIPQRKTLKPVVTTVSWFE